MLMRDGIAVLMRILIKRVPVYKLGFHSNLDYFAVFTCAQNVCCRVE